MFTLTISDKPVAVTNAAEDEARELFMSDEFREDLKTLLSEGAPLWDGFATLSIRQASEREISDFEVAEMDESDGEGQDDEGPLIVFLVEVIDPEDDDQE